MDIKVNLSGLDELKTALTAAEDKLDELRRAITTIDKALYGVGLEVSQQPASEKDNCSRCGRGLYQACPGPDCKIGLERNPFQKAEEHVMDENHIHEFEFTLFEFVKRASQKGAAAEEVEALPAVARTLMELLGLR